MSFKTGFIAIVGLPNVGKSTLINTLVGEKISIVSSKPQTTRNNILGIRNDEDSQIVFVDTPGLHFENTKLATFMNKSIRSASKEVDAILVCIDGHKGITQKDLSIIERFKENEIPIVVAINKIDISQKEKLMPELLKLNDIEGLCDVVPISAKKRKNLDELIKVLKKYLYEGERFFEDDLVTDKSDKFRVAEILREKLLLLYDKEIPHGIAIDIKRMEYNENKNIYNIYADIICEKDSHKTIIIGKQGSALKKAATYARESMEKTLNAKVFLELWVRVKENWKNSDAVLNDLDYIIKK